MNLRIAIACLPLILVGDGAVPKSTVPVPIDDLAGKSNEYRQAYAKGQAEADKALKEGRAVIYTYGLRRVGNNFNEETGLAYEPIAGCIVDDAILGRAAGNNERIKESIAKNGLPVNSMKKWEKELGDLEGYVQARNKIKPLSHLTIGGPASKSPDGKYAVRAVATDLKNPDGTPLDNLVSLVLTANGVDQPRTKFLPADDRTAAAIWGPEGSGFVIVVGRAGSSEQYEAIDARSGRSLKSEVAPVQAK